MSIWLALIDYGSVAWNRCMRLIRKTLTTQKKKSLLLGQKKSLLEKFDKSWGKHQVICVRVDSFVRWCYDGPRREEASSIKVSSTWWVMLFLLRGFVVVVVSFHNEFFSLVPK